MHEANKPTSDRFRLPSWWPASTDRGPSRSWWIIVASTDGVVAVIFLASGQWIWGMVCLAIGIVPTYIAVVDDGGRVEALERIEALDGGIAREKLADDRDDGNERQDPSSAG